MLLFQWRVADFMWLLGLKIRIQICPQLGRLHNIYLRMCVFIIYTAKSKIFPVIEVFSDSRKIPRGNGILGGKWSYLLIRRFLICDSLVAGWRLLSLSRASLSYDSLNEAAHRRTRVESAFLHCHELGRKYFTSQIQSPWISTSRWGVVGLPYTSWVYRDQNL